MGGPKGNKHAIGNKGGRPTKYTPEIVQQALDYLEQYNTEHGHAIPSAIGMSIVLKLDESTLYDWAKQEGNEFSKILPRCKKQQEFTLINGGLKSDLNSNIVKLVLGKHGYSDKQHTEHSGHINDYSDLEGDDLDRKLKDMRQKLDDSERD